VIAGELHLAMNECLGCIQSSTGDVDRGRVLLGKGDVAGHRTLAERHSTIPANEVVLNLAERSR